MNRLITRPIGVKLKNRRVKVCIFEKAPGKHVVGVRFARLISRQDREIQRHDFDMSIEGAEALATLLLEAFKEYDQVHDRREQR